MTDSATGKAEFKCQDCGKPFSLAPEILERYPGWTPRTCLPCRDKARCGGKAEAGVGGAGSGRSRSGGGRRSGSRGSGARAAPGGNSASRELNLTVDQVLQRFTEGPTDGVFTDGACSGNPGPGGWGCVFVRNNAVVAQRHGAAENTTNNRMELTALINGYQLISPDDEVTIWSDSELCVKTINEWAVKWEANGWRRKTGPVKNLELVKEARRLAQERPKSTLRWIRAHDGSRWNEYADSLATAYLRDAL